MLYRKIFSLQPNAGTIPIWAVTQKFQIFPCSTDNCAIYNSSPLRQSLPPPPHHPKNRLNLVRARWPKPRAQTNLAPNGRIYLANIERISHDMCERFSRFPEEILPAKGATGSGGELLFIS